LQQQEEEEEEEKRVDQACCDHLIPSISIRLKIVWASYNAKPYTARAPIAQHQRTSEKTNSMQSLEYQGIPLVSHIAKNIT
jgi:hypothetical protein